MSAGWNRYKSWPKAARTSYGFEKTSKLFRIFGQIRYYVVIDHPAAGTGKRGAGGVVIEIGHEATHYRLITMTADTLPGAVLAKAPAQLNLRTYRHRATTKSHASSMQLSEYGLSPRRSTSYEMCDAGG